MFALLLASGGVGTYERMTPVAFCVLVLQYTDVRKPHVCMRARCICVLCTCPHKFTVRSCSQTTELSPRAVRGRIQRYAMYVVVLDPQPFITTAAMQRTQGNLTRMADI